MIFGQGFRVDLTCIGGSNAVVHCSPNLLEAIKHNLHMAGRQCLFEEDVRSEHLEAYMRATNAEILRLHQYPELFPSKDIEEDFWRDIHYVCDDLVEKAIPNVEDHNEEEKALQAVGVEIEQDTVLPSRDAQRKPWEQFLHNRAPGGGIDVSTFGGEGSIQILPMAAIRILMATNEENKSIIRDIEAVSF